MKNEKDLRAVYDGKRGVYNDGKTKRAGVIGHDGAVFTFRFDDNGEVKFVATPILPFLLSGNVSPLVRVATVTPIRRK